MDERTIFSEIIGQLGIIVQQQTQELKSVLSNNTNSQKVDIVVSGNSLSLLDVVCNDTQTAAKLKGVADSFNVLNRQLEDYETIFKGIQNAQYSGKEGQIEYIVDFLNILTDSVYLSKLENVNRVLNSQKTVISDFFKVLTDDMFLEKIGKTFNVFSSVQNSIDELFEFFKNFNNIGETNKESISSINSIVESLSFLGQDEIVDRFGRYGDIFTKGNAQRLGEFFSEFDSRIGSIDFGENKKALIGGIISVLNYLGSDELKTRMEKSMSVFNKDNADLISDFFENISSRIGSIDFGENKKALIGGIISVLNYLGSDEMGSNMARINAIFNKSNAQRLGEFFVEFADKINSVDYGRDKITLIGGINGLIETLGGSDIEHKFNVAIQSFNSENAQKLGRFFVDLTMLLNGVSIISQQQKQSLSYIRSLINMMGDDNFVGNINRILSWASQEKSLVFGQFFVELSKQVNDIPLISKQQTNCIKYLFDLLSYMNQDNIIDNIEKNSNRFNQRFGRRIGEFFNVFAESLKSIPDVGEDKERGVSYILSLLNFMAQEGMARTFAFNSFWYSSKLAKRLAGFYVAFGEVVSMMAVPDKERIDGINYIHRLIELLGSDNFSYRLRVAQFFLSEKTAKVLGGFLKSFGDEIASISVLGENQLKSINSVLNLLQMISYEGLAFDLWKSSLLLDNKTAKKLGSFFNVMSEEFANVNFSSFNLNGVNSFVDFLNTITSAKFLTKLKLANYFYGKNKDGLWRTNPLIVPQWWYTHLVHELGNPRTVGWIALSSVQIIQRLEAITTIMAKVADFLSVITSPSFIKSLRNSIKVYGKKNDKWRIDPRVIPAWFNEFFEEFNGMGNANNNLGSLNSISDFVNTVCSPLFMTKLALGDFVYRHIDGNVIPKFFSAFVEGLDGVFGDHKTLAQINQGIVELRNIVEGLLGVSGKLFLVGLVGLALIGVAPGILMTGIVIKSTMWMMNSIVDTMLERGYGYDIAIDNLNDCLLKLSLSLIIITVAMKIAENIGLGAMKIIVPMMGVVAVFGIVILIDKLQKNFQVGNAIAEICINLVLISLAILALTAAMVIANNITGQGFVAFFGVLIGVMAIVGLFALIQYTGVGMVAVTGVLAVGAAMLVLSFVMLVVLKIVEMASSTAKQLPMIKMLITGLVDIMWEVGLKSALLGVITPLLLVFAVGVTALLIVSSLAVMVGKIARLWSPMDKIALNNVIKGMIGAFDLIDDYFDSKTFGSSIPVLGMVGKFFNAFGASVNLALFTASVGGLMIAVTMTIIVSKMARMVGTKDIKSLKDVVGGMIGVLDMVDEHFGKRTWFFGGIPVVGAVLKFVNALGGCLSLAMFAVSIGALMLVTTLTIGVMNLSRTVSKRDLASFKDVLEGMFDILDMVDEHFGKRTWFFGGIPVVGAVLKTFNALGAGLSIIMFSVSMGVMMSVVGMTIAVLNSAKKIQKTDIENLKAITSGMLDIFEDIGGPFLFGLMDNISKGASAGVFAAAMTPILGVTNWFINLVKKYNETDKQIGNGGVNSVAKKLVQSFKTFMDDINNSFSIFDVISNDTKSIIVKSMIPMLKTIGDFVDVVAKVATMTYLVGYDSNGKAIFRRIPESAFSDAAIAISEGFGSFLTNLETSFKNIKGISADVMEDMGEALIPMMMAVSSYVDSIVKLASAQVVVGYDENGNPKYKQLDFSPNGDGKKAALALSTMFSTFMTSLGNEMEKLKNVDEDTLKSLGEALMPMMMGISSFSDAIVKLGTSMIPDQWDKEGKPVHFKQVGSDVYSSSAQVLASNFGTFIAALRKESDTMKGASKDEAQVLTDCMSTLMGSIGSFADAIVKLSVAGTPKYNNRGQIIGWEKIDSKSAAEALVGSNGAFTLFMETLKTGFDGIEGQSLDTVQVLSNAMEPLMTGISLFVNSIIKMSTGTYVEGYDKNGKPITKLVPMDRYKTAANTISDNFSLFVNTLKTRLYANNAQITDTLKALNEGGIADIMKSIGNFVEAISKYTSGKMFVIEGFDKNGKPIYKKQGGKLKEVSMKQIAENIANGFSTFVSVLATKLSQDSIVANMEKAESVIDELDELMNPVKSFTDTILKFKESKPETFGTLGSQLGTGMINILLALDGQNNYLVKFGSDATAENIETICGSLGSLMDILEDLTELKIEDDIVEKSQNAGTALISLLTYLDGGNKVEGLISKFSSDVMGNNIRNFVENSKVLIDLVDDYNGFIKYDFPSILKSEQQFANAVRFLMTIDFANYEPKFGQSVNKTIRHLNNIDKKFKGSAKVVNQFKDAVLKAVDMIEYKLAHKEKERNKRFETLASNLDKVANKLKGVQEGLVKLQNSNFGWVDRLGDKLKGLEKIQNGFENLENNGMQFNTNRRTSNDNHPIIPSNWDGKTAIPVVIVNGQTDNNGKVTGADAGGMGVIFDFGSGGNASGKMFFSRVKG